MENYNHFEMMAGVVLYNPNIPQLRKNLESILTQFTIVCLIDNGSNNLSAVEELVKGYRNVALIRNQKNMGIAFALNQICQFADNKSYNWVLTVDQDSVCPLNLSVEYRKYLDEEQVGMICPVIQDRNRGNSIDSEEKNSFIEQCITSGSLVRIAAWKAVNKFDELMFIDGVDFDFCFRLRKTNFKILRVSNVILSHAIGKISHHKILCFDVIAMNHNAFRKYYISRNTVYFARKNGTFSSVIKSILQNIKSVIKVTLFEEDKKSKLINIGKGTVDGFHISISK